jgi:hypothetical protein
MCHIGYTFRRRRGTVLTHPTFNRLTAAAGRTIFRAKGKSNE